jgi:hypothetical protein
VQMVRKAETHVGDTWQEREASVPVSIVRVDEAVEKHPVRDRLVGGEVINHAVVHRPRWDLKMRKL